MLVWPLWRNSLAATTKPACSPLPGRMRLQRVAICTADLDDLAALQVEALPAFCLMWLRGQHLTAVIGRTKLATGSRRVAGFSTTE